MSTDHEAATGADGVNTLAPSTVLQDDLQDALQGIAVGLSSCQCPGAYHTIWGALRATGAGHGLESEAPVLDPLLDPLVGNGSRVLIAGAADANSLRMLHGLAQGRAVQFSVADRCPAPLRRASDWAQRRGIELQVIEADLADLPGRGQWDLAFLHYTLSFGDAQRRRQVLAALAAVLSAKGVIVCALKFDAGAAETPAAAAQRWLARMSPLMSQRLSGHPETWARIEPLLSGYALQWAERKAMQASPDRLEGDFASAGLRVHQRIDTPRSPLTARRNSLAAHDQYSQVWVAARADGTALSSD